MQSISIPDLPDESLKQRRNDRRVMLSISYLLLKFPDTQVSIISLKSF
jgi:hypothetical protein